MLLQSPRPDPTQAPSRPVQGATAETSFLTEKSDSITNGGVSDHLFLFAVTDPSRSPQLGISAFVIPRNSKGLDVVKVYGLLGMRGANVAHLRFRQVSVPGEYLVGGLNRAFQIILDELDQERPAVAAE